MALTKAALSRGWKERRQQYDRAQTELIRVLEEVISDLGSEYQVRPVPFIGGKRKTFDSFYGKACRYQEEKRVGNAADCFSEIKDIARARVICQTLTDVGRVKQLLEQNEAMNVVGEPQVHEGGERGYRGVHLEVEVNATVSGKPVATTCEVQIQTAVQFAWALFTHKDFYKGGEVPDYVGELMAELSDLLHVADRVAGTLIKTVEQRSDEAHRLPPLLSKQG
jgi:ppGpp synthetase/RelA/SpoT-type nucleotidyltranferase